jgi:hypothetical protein
MYNHNTQSDDDAINNQSMTVKPLETKRVTEIYNAGMPTQSA